MYRNAHALDIHTTAIFSHTNLPLPRAWYQFPKQQTPTWTYAQQVRPLRCALGDSLPAPAQGLLEAASMLDPFGAPPLWCGNGSSIT
jgi:hypothetical protein